jgi:hypothetical protein
VNLCDCYFYKVIGKLTVFFGTSGVRLPVVTIRITLNIDDTPLPSRSHTQPSNNFHYHRSVFYSQFKSRDGHILDKVATLRMTLTIDEVSITSRSYTHHSHSSSKPSKPLTREGVESVIGHPLMLTKKASQRKRN